MMPRGFVGDHSSQSASTQGTSKVTNPVAHLLACLFVVFVDDLGHPRACDGSSYQVAKVVI